MYFIVIPKTHSKRHHVCIAKDLKLTNSISTLEEYCHWYLFIERPIHTHASSLFEALFQVVYCSKIKCA